MLAAAHGRPQVVHLGGDLLADLPAGAVEDHDRAVVRALLVAGPSRRRPCRSVRPAGRDLGIDVRLLGLRVGEDGEGGAAVLVAAVCRRPAARARPARSPRRTPGGDVGGAGAGTELGADGRSSPRRPSYRPTASSHWTTTWPLAFWVPLPLSIWRVRDHRDVLAVELDRHHVAVVDGVDRGRASRSPARPRFALSGDVAAGETGLCRPRRRSGRPCRPMSVLSSLLPFSIGTPNAATGVRPLGGSKEATGGGTGVGLWPHCRRPSVRRSDFLSSSPLQPATRISRAAAGDGSG